MGEETKMSGLYKEEPPEEGQPSLWAGKFRVEGRICQVETEGCWENLEAGSALIHKICTSVPCQKPDSLFYCGLRRGTNYPAYYHIPK